MAEGLGPGPGPGPRAVWVPHSASLFAVRSCLLSGLYSLKHCIYGKFRGVEILFLAHS